MMTPPLFFHFFCLPSLLFATGQSLPEQPLQDTTFTSARKTFKHCKMTLVCFTTTPQSNSPTHQTTNSNLYPLPQFWNPKLLISLTNTKFPYPFQNSKNLNYPNNQNHHNQHQKYKNLQNNRFQKPPNSHTKLNISATKQTEKL